VRGILKGYFIQYKFILPETTKHSSYTYQKLFRSLYGYTQIVNKSNGKTYKYHRPGILSSISYIRPGKNCVIIPQGALQRLTSFFKTGKNPTHAWRTKGDWKAVYYMNEKEISIKDASRSIEDLIERTYVGSTKKNLLEELERAVSGTLSAEYNSMLLSDAKEIITNPWFSQTYSSSKKLTNFKAFYDSLKRN